MTNQADQEVGRLQPILRYVYGIVPIVAGADKFTNLLVHWSDYLPAGIAAILPFSPETFMMIVGVIEIIAGILVLARTLVGAYVVSAWLVLIALTLLFSGRFLDVAVRDLVMAMGAFVLARLTLVTEARLGRNPAAATR
jgi:uncharacterized membrane protein YphA (DoxX/SURF4 family)